jgi:hypothetical protein
MDNKSLKKKRKTAGSSYPPRSTNSCSLPTGSKPFIQSKIEQSKHKQKYQDFTIPVLLLFVFRFFTPSTICPLPSVLSLFSKWEKAKRKRKQSAKNTR